MKYLVEKYKRELVICKAVVVSREEALAVEQALHESTKEHVERVEKMTKAMREGLEIEL